MAAARQQPHLAWQAAWLGLARGGAPYHATPRGARPDASLAAPAPPASLAGFHGVELALLLLAEFVADGRTYVAKQRRIEQVADDIAAQVGRLRSHLSE